MAIILVSVACGGLASGYTRPVPDVGFTGAALDTRFLRCPNIVFTWAGDQRWQFHFLTADLVHLISIHENRIAGKEVAVQTAFPIEGFYISPFGNLGENLRPFHTNAIGSGFAYVGCHLLI